MFRNFKNAALFASAFAVLACPAALADEHVSVLILGDDGDVESIPRNAEAFQRMVVGMTNAVEARGFAVYDESAIEDLGEGRLSHRPAELVELSQTVEEASIDVVTTVTYYARAMADGGTGDISVAMSVSGVMYEVPGARWVGQYNIDVLPGDLPSVPDDCDNACLVAFVSDQAEQVGADVGAQLRVRLELIGPAQ